jgi:dienelactone hydrolase
LALVTPSALSAEPGATVQIALFHSVLGVRPGVHDAADRLRASGHDVLVVDQYEGRVFDDYEEAGAFAEAIGYGELMRRAAAAVESLPDGFLVAGFSNGGGMAEYVATVRPVAGVAMLSGALPMSMLGVERWPAGVPAQIHYTADDPFRNQDWIDAVVDQVQAAGGPIETFDYPGAGHLFTDPTMTEEYDPDAAERLWERVHAFCSRVADGDQTTEPAGTREQPTARD